MSKMTKGPPKWALGPHDDICEGVEVRLNEDGTIDEVVADGFHLEQMDDGQYWLNFRVGDDWQHVMLHRHGKHIYPTVYR